MEPLRQVRTVVPQEPLKTLVERLPQVCGLCRQPGKVRYLDYDTWACEKCAQLYLVLLRHRG